MIQAPLERATLALGRLDALTLAELLPETRLFLYAGYKRNRRFAYREYLAILNEGTELE